MQVIKTDLKSSNGEVREVNVLFDGGSDRSFITESLARRLQLRKSGEEFFAFSGFGGTGSGPHTKRKTYMLELGGQALELTEIPIICADMYRAPVAVKILNKFGMKFTEDLNVGRPVKVDILIGLDYYWSLVTGDMKRVAKLVAQRTCIGWMLSGKYDADSKSRVTAKLLFQELWELGIDWDDELPGSLRDRFKRWLEDLDLLPQWKIPRRFALSSWAGAEKVKVHIFCDASEKAYGCCAYLWLQEKEQVKVYLIMFEVRVSPLKGITLPSLELLAALLGSRIFRFLQTSLQLPSDVEYRCYSDSMTVLVREDSCPRLQWPLGVIQELIEGRCGVKRTAKVKTKSGSFTRPIQRIHDLELHAHPVFDMPESEKDELPTTRYGRQSKPPDRFTKGS
ncbi:Pao retrotransposon peptidase family protein [Elysia marginata]|uniref:Pao retrotransposon peptidase family protein n=1 Tax=Elysia marginata TaxID=1093978 RepID=A0AAV4I3C2_9GAST|nr:Pao retrotransposon peptidase family protein [Elysia marginata]